MDGDGKEAESEVGHTSMAIISFLWKSCLNRSYCVEAFLMNPPQLLINLFSVMNITPKDILAIEKNEEKRN